MLLDHLSPGVTLIQSLGVTHYKEEVSWTSDRHVEAPYICQEAQASVNRVHCVRSHTIENNYVFLSALEGVHSVYLDIVKLATD